MMLKLLASVLAAALLFLGALTAGSLARTEPTLIWTEKSSGGLVALAYGPANPQQNPLFLLSCFNEMDIAVLDVHKDVAGAAPGEPLTIELAAGTQTSPVQGEAARDEANGVTFAEASDIELAPILAVLREPGPVTVTMGDTSATLAEQGRAEAVSQFSENCQVK